jgi:hypothetical protein
MSALSDVLSATLRKAIGNFCLTKVALAIHGGSAAATIASTGTMTFVIDGRFYTKAALSAQSFAVTHDFRGIAVSDTAGISEYTQPVTKTAYYLVCVNSGGTVAIVQGTYSGQSITVNGTPGLILTGDGDIPAEPSGYTAIGMVKIALANAATFNPATTNFDATDVTATFYDLNRVPATAP